MPEEKKVQTFGFTRDDIKEIARGEVIEYADDVVKKAIADGDIEIPEELPATTDASEGDVLKLDASKNPVWGAAGGGGSKLYLHILKFGTAPSTNFFVVISDSNEPSEKITTGGPAHIKVFGHIVNLLYLGTSLSYYGSPYNPITTLSLYSSGTSWFQITAMQYGVVTNGALSYTSVYASDFVSDTVTEL